MKSILITCIILLWGTSYGQVKIDNIEISKEIAKEYFQWLEDNPDTLWFAHSFEKQPDYKVIYNEDGDSVYVSYYGRSYTMSEEESDAFYNHIGYVSKEDEDFGDFTISYDGYIVRRKPTTENLMEFLRK